MFFSIRSLTVFKICYHVVTCDDRQVVLTTSIVLLTTGFVVTGDDMTTDLEHWSWFNSFYQITTLLNHYGFCLFWCLLFSTPPPLIGMDLGYFWLIFDRLAKQGDNVLGNVRPSVCQCAQRRVIISLRNLSYLCVELSRGCGWSAFKLYKETGTNATDCSPTKFWKALKLLLPDGTVHSKTVDGYSTCLRYAYLIGTSELKVSQIPRCTFHNYKKCSKSVTRYLV